MRNITSIVLVLMMGAFGALLWIQRDGDAAAPVVVATPAKAVEKAAPDAPKPLARTLRTTALGWELVAPGVISSDAFKAAGVDAAFAAVGTMDEVEAALAKGGGEAGGADVAFVPLASYVASYERLRALSPEIIFVIGWSRGREALYGTELTKVAAPLKLAAAPGAPETFFALALLDLAGVPTSKVELVDDRGLPPGGSAAEGRRGVDAHAPLQAVARPAKTKPTGKLVVSSADTPMLEPIVAVAPRGFVDAHAHELELWSRVWLGGVTHLAADVPAAARQVAAIAGAPPVLAIIEALGQLEFANLRENAVALGLSGRGALTLDQTFRTAWRIWRDTGVLTTPPPEVSPLEPRLVATLARTDQAALVEPPPHVRPAGDKRPEILLVVAVDKLDADALAARIGLVAGIFDHLALRITAKTAQASIDTARERFGLHAPMTVGKRQTPAIEVLSAP